MSNAEYERGFAAGFKSGFDTGRGTGILGGYVPRPDERGFGLRADCGRLQNGPCAIANCCRQETTGQFTKYRGAVGGEVG